MKDNISLIAAAAGGFMLSLAAASIIKAAPIPALQVQPRLSSNPAANLQLQPLSSQPKTLKHQEPIELDFELAPE